MTIDEDPQDKHGPIMFVRYFAGMSNTHLGQAMFEVDRLMKCFGQGADNVTREPLRPRFDGFLTQAEISHALGDSHRQSVWSRFWANLTTGRFPTNDIRGKPVLEQSRDGRTIYFLEHRIWIDTEQMYDPGQGRRLESSGGVRSPSAEKFADLLTATYDKIAAEFPVFGHLHELSKLVVLSEWLRDSKAPFDPELLCYHIASRTRTPATTPSLSTTNSWTNALSIQQIMMFGGVSLDGTPHYGTTKDPTRKRADSTAELVEKRRSELRAGEPVQVASPEGTPQILVPLGPPIRGPPAAPGMAADTRAPVRFMEVQGRLTKVSRDLDDPVLGRHELPLRTDSATGKDMLDMPILREQFSPRHRQTVTFTSAEGAQTKVNIPDQLYLTSPSRQISIPFETDPKFDAQRNQAYFPSKAPGVKGYYPKDRTVRMDSGAEFKFDGEGLPAGVKGLGLPSLAVSHPAYLDGPCIPTPVTPATMPRAPPYPAGPVRIMESSVRRPAVSRELESPNSAAPLRTRVLNQETGRQLEVREETGRLFFMNK
jgi:hypothetical protein